LLRSLFRQHRSGEGGGDTGSMATLARLRAVRWRGNGDPFRGGRAIAVARRRGRAGQGITEDEDAESASAVSAETGREVPRDLFGALVETGRGLS